MHAGLRISSNEGANAVRTQQLGAVLHINVHVRIQLRIARTRTRHRATVRTELQQRRQLTLQRPSKISLKNSSTLLRATYSDGTGAESESQSRARRKEAEAKSNGPL